MTSAFESIMNEMTAKLELQREGLRRLRQGVAEVSGSARSKRRQVSVTVDARGDITELKFHGQEYRSLAPPELADIIVATIREARADAQAQLWKSVDGYLPDSETAEELRQVATGQLDWVDAAGNVMELPEALMEIIGAPPTNPINEAEFTGFVGEAFTGLGLPDPFRRGTAATGDDDSSARGASSPDEG